MTRFNARSIIPLIVIVIFWLGPTSDVHSLKCYVCNSGMPGEEKCVNISDYKEYASSVSKNCDSFQDSLAILNSGSEASAPVSSGRRSVLASDWEKVGNDKKHRHRGVCKLIRTSARVEEPPGFKGNKTKKVPTRFLRYCSWESIDDLEVSRKTDLSHVETCRKPSVSRRFDVTVCTCHDRDLCNGGKSLMHGMGTKSWTLILILIYWSL